jgi:predicted double-glycine peptidase
MSRGGICLLAVLLEAYVSVFGGPDLGPQCGQYCVYHLCRLKGIPATMGQILEMFPPKERGDSLLDLSEALEKLGFQCVGKRLFFEEMCQEPFPLVAHFRNVSGSDIGHFVVVEEVLDTRVKVFSGDGRREIMSSEHFQDFWSGIVLILTGQSEKLPSFLSPVPAGSPQIRFETLFLDCGELSAEEQEVYFPFSFENCGDGDLKIEKVETSCSCVRVEGNWGQAIPPGDRGTLTVVYKLGETRGRFSQSVWLYCNDPHFPVIELSVNGSRVQDVIISPLRIDFGSILKGQKAIRQCSIHYEGESILSLSQVESVSSSLKFTVRPLSAWDIQKDLPQGKIMSCTNLFNRYVGEIEIDTSQLHFGEYKGKIELKTEVNREERKIRIPVFAEVIMPVRLRPSRLFLGEIRPGQKIEQTVLLESLNQQSLRLISAECQSCPLRILCDEKAGIRIPLRFTGLVSSTEQVNNKQAVITVVEEASGEKHVLSLTILGRVSP